MRKLIGLGLALSAAHALGRGYPNKPVHVITSFTAAGMPADIVAKINADVRRALADPAVKDRLANLGNDVMDMSPQEFARFVRSEIDDYQRVVRAAGIKPQ